MSHSAHASLEARRLQSRPLADLHELARDLGIEHYRLLRKPELADAIDRAGSHADDHGDGPALIAFQAAPSWDGGDSDWAPRAA